MTRRQKRQPVHERLLETAINHFGREGLSGASTRAIATAAGTMMSSITYHFGGKEGLHLAAAQHIADQIMERMGPVLAASEGACTREDASAAILAILDRFTEVMTHPESEPWARFIVREQMEPTDAFDALFETVGQVAGRVAFLLGLVSEGRFTPFEARLRVLAIVGQALAYRTAHAALLRLTGWSEVDAEGVAAIKRIVHEHTRAILSSELGASSDE
jgi:AcrR family transcriptional regulator